MNGLKYIGNESLTYGERIFWIFSFGTALAFALYFIQTVYRNYNNTPVIVVLNPSPVYMDEVPFPALTVCDMNKMKRSQAETILKNGTLSEKDLIEGICDFIPGIQSQNRSQQIENITVLYDFIERVSQPCKEMLKMCKWRKMTADCEQLFGTVMTDDGLCCSFNRLPTEFIFRGNDFIKIKDDYNYNLWDNWNPEKGYSINSSSENVFPFKSLGIGANQGLTIVLNVSPDYYCSSTNSEGFKLRFHTPLEVPRIESFSYLILPDHEYHIYFKPIIQDSTNGLRSMDIQKRKCYFVGEKYLKYFRTYNQLNCRTECLVNYTFQICGCMLSYIPNNPTEAVCGVLQEGCRENVEAYLDQQENKDSGSKCNCLPECFQLEYKTSLSFSKIWTKKIKNSTIIRIYSESPFCDRTTRTELYGFSEFLSFTGGLLSLFLGLSSLSIVEIIYHLTLRWFCQIFCSKQNVIKVYPSQKT